jgi:hypothetical protein
MAHLQRMRVTLGMGELEYEREALSIRQQQVTALQALIETAKASYSSAPNTYEMLSDADESLITQEKLIEQIREEEDLLEKVKDLTTQRRQVGMEIYQINEDNLTIEKKRVENLVLLGQLSQWVADMYIESLDQLYKAQKQDDLIKAIEDYQEKIKLFGASNITVIRAQRDKAIKAAREFENMPGYDGLIANINQYYDLLEKKEAWNIFSKNAQNAINQITSLFSAISQAVLSFQKRDLDIYIADLEAKNNALQEALDKELQARLYAAGVGKADTKDQYDNELQNAIATGNHRLIYEAQQAYKQWEIEKDINDKKENAAKQLAKEKAKLEHEYAMNQWKVQVALGYANAAQAIMVAAASASWPYNLIPIGFATGIGAAQIAAIYGAQPPAPKFETGGIVKGNPYRGDSQQIMTKGGEMVLTAQDQTELLDMIRKGNEGQPIIIQTIIELDRELIAEKIFELGSLGNSFIKARGVIK